MTLTNSKKSSPDILTFSEKGQVLGQLTNEGLHLRARKKR